MVSANMYHSMFWFLNRHFFTLFLGSCPAWSNGLQYDTSPCKDVPFMGGSYTAPHWEGGGSQIAPPQKNVSRKKPLIVRLLGAELCREPTATKIHFFVKYTCKHHEIFTHLDFEKNCHVWPRSLPSHCVTS